MPASHHLERFRVIARGLDSQFKLPGLPIRFGWDAILGLVPGIGDVSTGIVASYGLFAGYRLGAPAVVLLRMLGNIALDTVIGAVPILGDLFDIGWKGNLRNLALLERWLDEPHQVRQRSAWLLVSLIVCFTVVLASTVWMLIWLFSRLLH